MELIVERIAEDFVILELDDRSHIHVPKAFFSELPREGDIVLKTEDGRYRIDAEKTAQRRQMLAERTKRLFRRNS